MRPLSLVVPMLLFAHSVSAQVVSKYSPIFLDEADPSIFFLIGEIDSRTALNFDRAMDEYGIPDVLVLTSDGGLVNVALMVAREVRERGISTLIPADSACYSACSFVFFAGIARIADGELGLHQISNSTGDIVTGQVAISDILDVVGNFDVPTELIVAMLRTPPDQMYIVSEEEKVEFGFFLRDQETRQADGTASMEERAVLAYINYHNVWNLQNDEALSRMATMFAPEVDFYGKRLSRLDVLNEKRKFAARWPIRNYVVDAATLSASCVESICTVLGDVVWDARSPERSATSRGLAYFILRVRILADGYQILDESGHVKQRY